MLTFMFSLTRRSSSIVIQLSVLRVEKSMIRVTMVTMAIVLLNHSSRVLSLNPALSLFFSSVTKLCPTVTSCSKADQCLVRVRSVTHGRPTGTTPDQLTANLTTSKSASRPAGKHVENQQTQTTNIWLCRMRADNHNQQAPQSAF